MSLFPSPRGEGELSLIFFPSSFRLFLGVSQTVALAVGLDDVHAVGEAVKERTGDCPYRKLVLLAMQRFTNSFCAGEFGV